MTTVDLAQYDYQARQIGSLLYGLISSYYIVCIGIVLLGVISKWIVFKKGGEKGWKSLIPIYSKYTEYKMYWSGFVFFLNFLLPLIGICVVVYGVQYAKTAFVTAGILMIVSQQLIRYIFYYKKAKFFNQGGGFAVGLFFLGYIFNLIIAFDSKCKHY